MSETDMPETLAVNSKSKTHILIRGSLRININTSCPQVMAGSDFSIFVIIQNPFDVPITIHQVLTHIPIELIDVNGLRIILAKHEEETKKSSSSLRNIYESFKYRLMANKSYSGIAIAVGTDFGPTDEQRFVIKQSVGSISEGGQVTGVKIDHYDRDLMIPVQLQPGDSIVKQFVLRTRHWLFFTPLTHRFQIQVNYTGDGADHTDTIAL